MAAAFAQFGFVQVVFVASLVAIALQCVVYLVRRVVGLKAAWIVLRGSLIGFLVITAGALLVAWRSGELRAAVNALGWSPVLDFAVFILFTMFISYFMGDRYLADEERRAARSDADRPGTAATERGA